MNEIKPTFKITLRVWWSYLWRNLLMVVAAMILGGIMGFALGFVLGALGVPIATIKMIVTPIGAILGLSLSLFPIYWILGKDFGTFRLILVSKDPPADEQSV